MKKFIYALSCCVVFLGAEGMQDGSNQDSSSESKVIKCNVAHFNLRTIGEPLLLGMAERHASAKEIRDTTEALNFVNSILNKDMDFEKTKPCVFQRLRETFQKHHVIKLDESNPLMEVKGVYIFLKDFESVMTPTDITTISEEIHKSFRNIDGLLYPTSHIKEFLSKNPDEIKDQEGCVEYDGQHFLPQSFKKFAEERGWRGYTREERDERFLLPPINGKYYSYNQWEKVRENYTNISNICFKSCEDAFIARENQSWNTPKERDAATNEYMSELEKYCTDTMSLEYILSIIVRICSNENFGIFISDKCDFAHPDNHVVISLNPYSFPTPAKILEMTNSASLGLGIQPGNSITIFHEFGHAMFLVMFPKVLEEKKVKSEPWKYISEEAKKIKELDFIRQIAFGGIDEPLTEAKLKQKFKQELDKLKKEEIGDLLHIFQLCLLCRSDMKSEFIKGNDFDTQKLAAEFVDMLFNQLFSVLWYDALEFFQIIGFAPINGKLVVNDISDFRWSVQRSEPFRIFHIKDFDEIQQQIQQLPKDLVRVSSTEFSAPQPKFGDIFDLFSQPLLDIIQHGIYNPQKWALEELFELNGKNFNEYVSKLKDKYPKCYANVTNNIPN